MLSASSYQCNRDSIHIKSQQNPYIQSVDYLIYLVINLAEQIYQAHSELQPEKYYENLLYQLIISKAIPVYKQYIFNPTASNQIINTTLRCDLILNGILILEIKANNQCLPAYNTQLRIYQKLLNIKNGLLINFAAPTFYQAIKRFYI